MLPPRPLSARQTFMARHHNYLRALEDVCKSDGVVGARAKARRSMSFERAAPRQRPVTTTRKPATVVAAGGPPTCPGWSPETNYPSAGVDVLFHSESTKEGALAAEEATVATSTSGWDPVAHVLRRPYADRLL